MNSTVDSNVTKHGFEVSVGPFNPDYIFHGAESIFGSS